MDVRQLRYFIDIARTQHLTASAQNLFVTPSTMSHGLRQLEQELGATLFDRLGRGLKLSQAGAVYLDHALRALNELEAGRTALSDMNGLKTGRLSIGAFPTFLATVAAAVARFNRSHPGVFVEVKSLRAAAIEKHLLTGEVDLCVASYPVDNADIEVEALFDEQLLLVVGPRHPLAVRRNLRLKALAGIGLALLPRTFALRRQIDDAFHEAGIAPQVEVEMEPVESLISLCRHDSIASILPERAARQASGLHRVRIDAPDMLRRAGILWRREASRSAAAREFATLLRDSRSVA